MSFRMGVFIEAFSNRAAAEKKTGETAQGAATDAEPSNKQPARRTSRKKADRTCVGPDAKRRRSELTSH